ncbi:hypothetical protein IMCC13023_07540 [Candidatus Aquiluna sp. IMCC13023]|nr:hypothetical protein IMCC13023_07540 [Candidatus Aquiluna sp. IMCC13023]
MPILVRLLVIAASFFERNYLTLTGPGTRGTSRGVYPAMVASEYE